jgi:hypothetical protein
MTNNIIFYDKKRIEVFVNNGRQQLRNMPMNSADLVIWKNVVNTVEFMVKNLDRRPVELMGSQLVLNILDSHNNTILLSRPMHIVDEHKGIAAIQLQPWETVNFPLGFHQYSILLVDQQGEKLLMLDRDQSTVAVLEVKQASTTPQWRPSIVVNTWTPTVEGQSTIYTSSSLKGSLQVNNITNLHTIAVYASNYSGSFFVQGSLSKDIPTNIDWFYIDLMDGQTKYTFKDFSGIETFNIIAPLNWIRFIHSPNDENSIISQVIMRN